MIDAVLHKKFTFDAGDGNVTPAFMLIRNIKLAACPSGNGDKFFFRGYEDYGDETLERWWFADDGTIDIHLEDDGGSSCSIDIAIGAEEKFTQLGFTPYDYSEEYLAAKKECINAKA